MKTILILLLGLSFFTGNAQVFKAIVSNKVTSSPFTPIIARWNLSITSFPVAGNNNVTASDGSNIGDQSSTDAATGWVFKTNQSAWSPYFGTYAAMGNGQGGSSAGSPTYTDFSADELQGGFLQTNKVFVPGQVLYPCQFTNLQAGTYELRVISSIKASVNTSLVNNEWHAKFGSGNADSTKTISNPTNYTTPSQVFIGTILGPTDTLKFGPFNPVLGDDKCTVANAFKLTRIN